ncbi:MAG: hypothetical protein KBT39_01845 [Bacteroidales bacterium]|nr:hypothetical protein [Bacteroidales bacterium]
MESGNKKFYTTVDCVAEGCKLNYEISLWELSSNEEIIANRVATRIFSISFPQETSEITQSEKEMYLYIYLRIMKTPPIESTPEFFKDDSNWKPLVSKLEYRYH